MKRFAELCGILETTRKTREKIAALQIYFQEVRSEDAMWAVRLLLGRTPPRIANTRALHQWALEVSNVPEWLFEESRNVVGDLMETLALVLPFTESPPDIALHTWIEEYLLPLQEMTAAERKMMVITTWQQMTPQQRVVCNKLLTGGFRPHVSEQTLVKALSAWRGLPQTLVAGRLKHDWPATSAAYRRLFSHDPDSLEISQPYPFQQVGVLDREIETLGEIADWQAGWHWKGLRAQVVKREGQLFIWSEDTALLSDKFPELCEALMAFPDGTALDGTILAWSNDGPLNLRELERRLRRKRITRQLLEEIPVCYVAADLLEREGEDVRMRNFSWRYARLQALLQCAGGCLIQEAPVLEATTWEALKACKDKARQHGARGILLKRLTSSYCADHWCVWPAEPLKINAVLLYVQRAQATFGKRSLEGTFGVWSGDTLIPVTKTVSGFSETDMSEVECFVKEYTIDRFGPVRSITPALVFTIAFDDVFPSSRHKSGLILENPRVICRQRALCIHDADCLDVIRGNSLVAP